jgi:hypothetical protein
MENRKICTKIRFETGRLIACENIAIERLNSEPLLLLSPAVQKPKRDECAWRKMWDLAVPEHYFSLSPPVMIGINLCAHIGEAECAENAKKWPWMNERAELC